jgi:hypothetical protein
MARKKRFAGAGRKETWSSKSAFSGFMTESVKPQMAAAWLDRKEEEAAASMVF